MNFIETEHHKITLQQAISKLAPHEPDDTVWLGIEAGLKELYVRNAIEKLPDYEPHAEIWNEIEVQISPKKSMHSRGWFAAAGALLIISLGLWKEHGKQSDQVSYAQESVDSRLFANQESASDSQYEKVKAYCEAEALVCSNTTFKRLKEEYETMSEAARQLHEAMGQYNTEPELIRQFTVLEQEKADLLNEMAKMI
jgi:hypothetical protein